MENDRDPDRCELCYKPLVVQYKNKRSSKRRAIDPITNKVLIVCNACGLRLNRAEWKNKLEQGSVSSPKILLDKNVCLKNFQLFSKSVCDILGDNNANKLYCSVITPKVCNCIQRHLINEENECSVESLKELQDQISLSAYNINKDRAVELYELHVKAQQLIKMKVAKPENRKLSLNEVRGIFHLRTEEYQKFVLANREKLKKNYKLCERAVQRVLCYSNNYLHKQLKTSPNGEARIAGKSAVVSKLLPDIDTLPYKKCCKCHCTNLALTHSRLVERWRNKALLGQRNARAVIAEMLTPAGGSVNCSLFLHLVTGCSLGLLRKVQKDLKQSDGIREPPEHGLREYWRRKKINAARRQDNNRHTITGTDKSETNSNVVNTSQMKIVEPSTQMNKSVIFKTTDFIRSNIINSSNIVNNNNYQNVNNLDSITQNQDNFILSSLELTNNENNDQFQFVEPVLTNTICHTSTSIPSVITSTNNSHVPSICSSSVVSNVEDNSEANVQFIQITKLPSNQTGVPVLKEDEITPFKSVIILPPNCFILNDTIIVSR